MINLLPPSEKKMLTAARTNSSLLRYNVILLGGAAFLTLALVVVFIFLMSIRATAEQTIAENQEREKSYTAVRSKAEQVQAEISSAKSIFDSELSYSKALVRYANLFPKGTAIDSMKLNEDSFSKPITIPVRVSGEQATKSLINSMQTSPYVTNFQRKEISLNSNSNEYPYTVNISFTLSKEIAK